MSELRIVTLLGIVEACWACRIHLVSASSWFEYSSGTLSICCMLPFEESAKNLWHSAPCVKNKVICCSAGARSRVVNASLFSPKDKTSWTVEGFSGLHHRSLLEWHPSSISFLARHFLCWPLGKYHLRSQPYFLGLSWLCWWWCEQLFLPNHQMCLEYLWASAIMPFHQAKLHRYFRERHRCILHDEAIHA